ncbi:hypothetical protein Lal_00042598 [Lupinus albus]|nr:hypothetical protein Lal_00042598 [Lupinus albus]
MIDFKDFSISSWNIRGAINKDGRCHAKDLVRKYKPSLIILMETHCQFISSKRFWNSLGYVESGIVEASGHVGGIWALSIKGGIYCGSTLCPFATWCHYLGFLWAILMKFFCFLSLGVVAWTTHEDFQNVVQEAWQFGDMGVVEGLNRFREDSISFNKAVFGNIFRMKRKVEARIWGVQRRLEEIEDSALVRFEA